MFRQLNPNFILIRLSRTEQERKRNGFANGILLHPSNVHMQHNLQAGEIVMIGRNVKEYAIKEIEVGDTAYFSHIVEGTYSTTENNKKTANEWLIDDTDADWRYYIVRACHSGRKKDSEGYEYGPAIISPGFLYGIKKSDGAIFMTNFYTLAIASPEERNNRGLKRSGHLYVFDSFKEERKAVEDRLAEMKLEAETHPNRAEKLQIEMEALTRSLNKKRAATFVPVFAPQWLRGKDGFSVDLDSTWILYYEIIGAKATMPQVTQLTIDGHTFYILRNDYILLAKKMSDKTLRKLRGEKVEEDEISESELQKEFSENQANQLHEKGMELERTGKIIRVNPYL